MIDERILNGAPRCTLIESFKGSVLVIGPDCRKSEHSTVEAAVRMIEDSGWVISIDHIHGSKRGKEETDARMPTNPV